MKNSWKTAGLVALSAAVLAYPAYMLYKYIAAKSKQDDMDNEEGTHLSSIFHKKAKAHNRSLANGHIVNGHANHQHS